MKSITQVICAAGHYAEVTSAEWAVAEVVCSVCQAEFCWHNDVDDDGSDDGRIPMGAFGPDERGKYRVPTERETRAGRTMWDYDEQRVVGEEERYARQLLMRNRDWRDPKFRYTYVRVGRSDVVIVATSAAAAESHLRSDYDASSTATLVSVEEVES